MDVRIDETREHPATLHAVHHFDAGGTLQCVADRRDRAALHEHVTLEIDAVRRIEQVHTGKEESLGR